jgi:hypothetical protein
VDLIQALTSQLDLWLDRYQVFFATEQADVDGCIAVLEEVRRKELNRVTGSSVLASHALDLSGGIRLAACRDSKSGKIVGCMRVTSAFAAKDEKESIAEYRLDLFSEEMLKQMLIFTRLCILKEHRKSVASFVLFSKTFAALGDEGYTAALLACEPNLFNMYRKLGARPIGRAHNSPSGGYRIPMVSIPDVAHLTACGSPLVKVIRKVDPAKVQPFIEWYRALEGREGEIPLGIAAYEGEDEDVPCHRLLTSGLSKGGVEQLLQNAMVISCQLGDVLVAERDGGKSIAFVKAGMVDVMVNDRKLAMLGPGEIFGEIAFTLDSARTARVTASVPGTEVLLLSMSAFQKLEDDADRAIVWRNMSRCLAQRLVARTSA